MTTRSTLQFSCAIALLLAGGCGKRPRGPEPTFADLENTNAPARATNAATTRFDARPGSKVRMDGTSNIHDWQVEGSLIGGYVEAGPNFPSGPGAALKPGKLDARASAFIIVRGLRSVEKDGKPYSDKMDEVMYEHMRMAAYPRIYFALEELVFSGTNQNGYLCQAAGTLALAGVTNKITLPVTLLPLDGQQLKVSGTTALKMTDFNIQPPSPTFLPIKTGDEVKLRFDWMLGQKAPAAPASK